MPKENAGAIRVQIGNVLKWVRLCDEIRFVLFEPIGVILFVELRLVL